MGALGNVVVGAGDTLAGQAWKMAAFVLAGLLLVVPAITGTGWWLASAARDESQADLAAEKGITAQLRAGVDDQNRAIRLWYNQAKAADARGTVARLAAEADGRRYDQALAQLAGAPATTCVDAMPYVNKMLEAAR